MPYSGSKFATTRATGKLDAFNTVCGVLPFPLAWSKPYSCCLPRLGVRCNWARGSNCVKSYRQNFTRISPYPVIGKWKILRWVILEIGGERGSNSDAQAVDLLENVVWKIFP